jgi:AraC family transcriptional regulator
MLIVQTKPVETLLFHSDLVAVGKFRCGAAHALYRNSGPCPQPSIVFPRSMTVIHHDRGPSFVGTPNTVSFYNRDQVYFREAISPVDASDWYALADDVLRDAIEPFDPAVNDRSGRPFRFAVGPSDARLYVAQRRLFEELERGDPIEPADVEERALNIAANAIGAVFGSRPSVSRRMRDAVEETKRRISLSFQQNAPLQELGAAVGVSPFHLCRAFSAFAGTTITGFRHALRLRVALERLQRPGHLTELALDLGYSSHSHFTSIFRRHFGIAPSVWAQERDSRTRLPALRSAQ